MKPTVLKRESCRLCGSINLVAELLLPYSVIADHYATEPNSISYKYPLDLYRCEMCGHIQMLDIIPLSTLFSSNYTYKPSRNPELVSHFELYSEYIAEVLGKIPSTCLDIGSNDGLFLSILSSRYDAKVLGIDPVDCAAAFAKANNIHTIQDFFNSQSAKRILNEYGQFDLISANNVFAHNDDLADFTSSVAVLLDEDGIFTFEISYLVDIVDHALVGTIFHEHLSHHSLTPLMSFLRKHGLYLFDVQHVNTQGGALIGYVSKKFDREQSNLLKQYLEHENKICVASYEYMQAFRSNLLSLKHNLLEILESVLKEDARLIMYGASRSANLLLEFFQLKNRVYCILDDNTEKVGKYVFESNIQIINASNFIYKSTDVVMPLAWIHSEKIYLQLKNKNVNCTFISFYPQIKVCSLG